MDEVTVNKFSQIVYLDSAPVKAKSNMRVGDMVQYYLEDPAGKFYLLARFGAIKSEYKLWLEFLTYGIDDIANFRIDRVWDRNTPEESGLYASGYRSPAGEWVVAFRGSEMLGNNKYKNDYATDFSLGYATETPQQADTQTYMNRFFSNRGERYYLTGHSLGGNLALHAAVTARDKDNVTACYAFNAPGFNSEYIRGNADAIALVSPKMTSYQNQYDIVSSLLRGIARPVIIESLFTPSEKDKASLSELLYPHSNFMFKKENGIFVRRTDGKCNLCKKINAFSILFLNLPVSLRKEICEKLLQALYLYQPPQKQLEFMTESVAELLMHNSEKLHDSNLFALGNDLILERQTHEKLPANLIYKTLLSNEGKSDEDMAGVVLLLMKLLQATE